MKITSTEEYGIRILVRVGSSEKEDLTITQIAEGESLTHANVAKICRLLRIGGFLESAKGHTGGYRLSKAPEEMPLSEIMSVLGEPLYGEEFCDKFGGGDSICTRSVDCSLRSVWKILQSNINSVLQNITLRDLMGTETQMNVVCSTLVK